jgi:hypothetical protein
MADVEIYTSDILSAGLAAWDECLEQADEGARTAIGLKRYKYPRKTVRSDGSIAGLIRDKTDTHHMQDSQDIDREDDETAVLFNDAEYATEVHEGRGDRPPQEFLKEAISAGADGAIEWQNSQAVVNIPQVFADAFAANL